MLEIMLEKKISNWKVFDYDAINIFYFSIKICLSLIFTNHGNYATRCRWVLKAGILNNNANFYNKIWDEKVVISEIFISGCHVRI